MNSRKSGMAEEKNNMNIIDRTVFPGTWSRTHSINYARPYTLYLIPLYPYTF
jgi:hypothetical protein